VQRALVLLRSKTCFLWTRLQVSSFHWPVNICRHNLKTIVVKRQSQAGHESKS
jgi:hypothetical protein